MPPGSFSICQLSGLFATIIHASGSKSSYPKVTVGTDNPFLLSWAIETRGNSCEGNYPRTRRRVKHSEVPATYKINNYPTSATQPQNSQTVCTEPKKKAEKDTEPPFLALRQIGQREQLQVPRRTRQIYPHTQCFSTYLSKHFI